MVTTSQILTKEDHSRAIETLRAVSERTDFSDEELSEYRALAQAVHDYGLEHSLIWNVPTDAVHDVEARLDLGENSLRQLAPFFGGMEPFAQFITRQRPLDAETIDALVSELGFDRDAIDQPFCGPVGWDDIERCTDGEDWRAELLAHRDAVRRKSTRTAKPEPQLAAL